jgi:hypothetical protein
VSAPDRSARPQRLTDRLFPVSQCEVAAGLQQELQDTLAPGFGAGAAAIVMTSGDMVKGSSSETAQAAPPGTAPQPAAPPPAPFDLTLPPGALPAVAPAQAQPARVALPRAATAPARAAAAPVHAADSEEEGLCGEDDIPNAVAPVRR